MISNKMKQRHTKDNKNQTEKRKEKKKKRLKANTQELYLQEYMVYLHIPICLLSKYDLTKLNSLCVILKTLSK